MTRLFLAIPSILAMTFFPAVSIAKSKEEMAAEYLANYARSLEFQIDVQYEKCRKIAASQTKRRGLPKDRLADWKTIQRSKPDTRNESFAELSPFQDETGKAMIRDPLADLVTGIANANTLDDADRDLFKLRRAYSFRRLLPDGKHFPLLDRQNGSVGHAGILQATIQCGQVLSSSEITFGGVGPSPVPLPPISILKGVNTSEIADGKRFRFPGLFAITGTQQWQTANGELTTLYVVEPVETTDVIRQLRNNLEADKLSP